MTIAQNFPSIQSLTRRSLLAGLPAAAVAPAAMAAPATDPMIALYKEWAEARALWVHLAETSPSGDANEPECEAAWDRKEAALFAMMQGQATSVEGIRMLACVMWDEEGWTNATPDDIDDDPLHYDVLRLLKAIIRSAEGIAA
ncbi:hypothetical protein [Limimaricola sp.]|uniref:hypothetical protein n=1 Tax=Limimaricola sp. TaxID=2211665 RepID=UPI004058414C